jgi:hypothetical protein
MNSEMFMQWVKDKLIPTFEKMFPGKKFILVADNAPYHHKRTIGSLASLTKKKLIQLMIEHNVEYVDLPLTDFRLEFANDDSNDIEDRGDCIRIPFDPEQQKQTASQSRPLVGNTHDLNVSFVTYLKENKPELLECQVEKALKDHGHRVLWTPPYCPELQPTKTILALIRANFERKSYVRSP